MQPGTSSVDFQPFRQPSFPSQMPSSQSYLTKRELSALINGLWKQFNELQVSSNGFSGEQLGWQDQFNLWKKQLLEAKSLIACDQERYQTCLDSFDEFFRECEKNKQRLQDIQERWKKGKNRNEDEVFIEHMLGKMELFEKKYAILTKQIKLCAERIEKKIQESTPMPDHESCQGVAYLIKNIVSERLTQMTLLQSQERHQSRLDRQEKLKTNWRAFKLVYEDMIALVGKLKIESAIRPKLTKLQKGMLSIQKKIQLLTESAIRASVTAFSQGFDEAKPRDLTILRGHLDSHGLLFNLLPPIHKKIEALEKEKDQLRPIIEASLKGFMESSHLYDSVTGNSLKSYFPASSPFQDSILDECLANHSKEMLQHLTEQQTQLINDWNQLCFNLNIIKHDLSSFARKYLFIMCTGEYYLSAEEMYGILHSTTQTAPLRETHQSIFNAQSEKFSILSELILSEAPALKVKLSENFEGLDDNSDAEEKGEEDISGDYEEIPKSSHMQHLYRKSLVKSSHLSKLRQPSTAEEAEKYGLIWDNEETKSFVLMAFDRQKKHFAQNHERHNKEFKEVFKIILPKMFKRITKTLAQMDKALGIQSNAYDKEFTQAYQYSFSERIGKKAKELVAVGFGQQQKVNLFTSPFDLLS